MAQVNTPWTRQPAQPIPIDWSNPLTRGLFVCIDGTRGVEQVSGRIMSPLGGITRRPGLAGIAHNSDGTDDYLTVDIAPRTLGECTIFALSQAASLVTDRRVFSLASSSGTFPYFAIGTGDTTASKMRTIYVASNGAVTGAGETAGTAFSVSRPIAQAITVKQPVGGGNYNPYSYIDGMYDGIAAGSGGAIDTVNRIAVGALHRSSGAVSFFPGSVFLALAWARALSDEEHRRLAANPWQLFAPMNSPLRLSTVPPTGAPTLSAVTATDITATTARLRVTVTY